ncbi:MAG: nucleotidyltransferase domain-containing protein [Spirochaetales bacterium]|nr:nucleotidyltransferase domain-containing protein [Spirochaetales bacterium]
MIKYKTPILLKDERMILEQKVFLENAIEQLKKEKSIIGIAAAGSYITGEMDDFSDIDLVIAIEPENYNRVMNEKLEIAKGLGNLLSAFTGEHVGEPRVLICLYDNPLIHVDLKFVSLDDIAHRVEDFIILWEVDNKVSEKLKEEQACFPEPSSQWLEDRFWIWVHYGAGKIGRGEIFETVELISFLRQTVIGPLILLKKGKQPKGVRKIEIDAPEYLERLKQSVVTYERESCYEGLKKIVELYKELRSEQNSEFKYNQDAEKASLKYLEDVYHKYVMKEGA